MILLDSFLEKKNLSPETADFHPCRHKKTDSIKHFSGLASHALPVALELLLRENHNFVFKVSKTW